MLNGQSVTLCPGTDQRGSPRPGVAASGCDAGAFETQDVGDLYAYAAGSSSSSNCPKTTDPSTECPLGRALALAGAGDTVKLETPGASGHYLGNWSIGTSGTSSSAPVTIDGSDVTGATLDGNGGSAFGCPTGACDGPVLTVTNAMFLVIKDLTITNADNSLGAGGGMQNDAGGTVTVSDSTFSNLFAAAGGAIDNGDGGSGTAMITNSTFSNDSANFGGAVNNGSGTVSITGSTFTGGNVVDGAAVDNADSGGSGTVSITDSTLSGGEAAGGGEVDTSDNGGSGVLIVTDSTLEASSGADLKAGGSGRVFVAGDVFGKGCQTGGTWTDDGFNAAPDTSCFSAGTGDVNAGSVAALKLGSLADNGGPTQTIALGAGSPAIGIIPNPTSVMLNGQSVKLCPGTDQRGSPRPGVAASTCDAGAYETPAVGNLYAYAAGSSSSSNCPKTTDPSTECPLGRALALAGAGDTVKLETPGASGHYVGNWSVGTSGTSSSAPVTIDGSDVTSATLDGNNGSASGCSTGACDGPVLFVGPATVVLKSVTIQNGSTDGKGAGLRSINGGTVTIIGSVFKGRFRRFRVERSATTTRR